MALADFEGFIDKFLAALRDFDRDRRGAPTKKTGAPEARAAMVTAFRLVAFRPGSGIATIEPDAPSEVETQSLVESEPVQLTNLHTLLDKVETYSALPDSVTDSLDAARRALGADGSITVEIEPVMGGSRRRPTRVRIDGERLRRIRENTESSPPATVETISGRLHQVDFEPDRLAIRAADGVDWLCDFPERLEPQVEALVNRLVWARGAGTLRSPTRGSMTIEEIARVEQGTQTDLFADERLSVAELASAQGIAAPQGIDSLAAAEWTDADEAFLSALTKD